MKTTKIYNSSAAVPSDLQSGGAEGAHLQCAVDCKSTNSMPADYKSTGTLPIANSLFRMASVLCTLYSVLFLAACSETDEITPGYNDAPLTISANIPGEVWAVASRADGESTISYYSWNLQYTDHKGVVSTYQANNAYVTVSGNSVSFSTVAIYGEGREQVVWGQVDATKPIHLYCTANDGSGFYSMHTFVASATAGQPLVLGEMKPTLAKLTVNFTMTHNMTTAPTAKDFTVSVDAKAASFSYDAYRDGGVWPIRKDANGNEIDAAATAFTISEKSTTTNTYTVTGSMLLPQQILREGETLTVTYGSTTWTLDLSTVAVTGSAIVQTANMLIAGQHLTLNLSASILSVGTPGDIQIEAFTAAADDDYTPSLDGVAKTYEYDAVTNTYTVHHPNCIEAALADRAANHPTAKVMYNGAELNTTVVNGVTMFVIDGAETSLEIVSTIINAAIAVGIPNLYVTGASLAEYSGSEAKTVVGEAIRQLTTNEEGNNDVNSPNCGTITLVLPAVTQIGEYAFRDCKALTSVSAPVATTIGNYAFCYCNSLTSVSAPKATTIGFQAFYSCTALTSMSAPVATTIGDYAFYNCTALESVSAPKVTTIGYYAFYNCTALTTLTFGSVIESVGYYVWSGTEWTVNCTLTLANGQQHMTEATDTTTPGTPNGTAVTAADESAEAAARTWAGKVWKSITISNNE